MAITLKNLSQQPYVSASIKKTKNKKRRLSLHHVWIVRTWLSASQEESSPGTEHCWILISDFPVSTLWVNKFMLFKPLKSVVFCFGSQCWLIEAGNWKPGGLKPGVSFIQNPCWCLAGISVRAVGQSNMVNLGFPSNQVGDV